jgi:hypothetical protein
MNFYAASPVLGEGFSYRPALRWLDVFGAIRGRRIISNRDPVGRIRRAAPMKAGGYAQQRSHASGEKYRHTSQLSTITS